MGTGACLLDKESDMPCGLIIEKVNGIPCEKRLTKDESFADVRYLLEMCKQVSHSSFPVDAHLSAVLHCKAEGRRQESRCRSAVLMCKTASTAYPLQDSCMHLLLCHYFD